jgi:hypothetical protein
VRKSLELVSAETAKIQMNKLYNKNMYRVISIMCFGDAANKVFKICQPGTILAILNPKFMPSKTGVGDD